MENLTFDLNDVFQSLVARMKEEGIFDREAYHDLVEEVLEEKRAIGELDDDNNIEEYEEKLKTRWPEAEELISTGHDQDVLDQA